MTNEEYNITFFLFLNYRQIGSETLNSKKVKMGIAEAPINKDRILRDINFTHFRGKPIIKDSDGVKVFYKKIDDIEIWFNQTNNGKEVEWVEITGDKIKIITPRYSFTKPLNVLVESRNEKIITAAVKIGKIPEEGLLEFLEELSLFVNQNRELLLSDEETKIENLSEDIITKDELSEDEKEELLEILKRQDLLRFIDEAFYERRPEDGFIIGEVESKHTLNFNCIGAHLGLSTINTLKGGSSIGKTNIGNVVTGLHRTKKVGSLSDTALKYADDMDEIDILYIQETLEDEFKNKETRLMSADDGGFIAETTVRNPKTGLFEVQKTVIPVKTLVTTTTAIDLDPEFATRNFIIPVDDSEEQTQRILKENFNSTEKKIQELKGDIHFNHKYELLRKAYTLLRPYTVLIPYEKDLLNIFPTSNPRARRDSKKLMQLIKESALLFQYQRCQGELNGHNVLIASWVDLAHALILSAPILEATLTGFDKRMLDALPIIYELISKNEYVTSKSLSLKIKKSSKYAWQILNFFEENGYIYHDPDTKKEKNIGGKTNVYLKNDDIEYKNLLLAVGNIDWLNMKREEEQFIKTEILNSSYQVGDSVYLFEYDPNLPNQVKYTPSLIDSEEFRIYKSKAPKGNKSLGNTAENLIGENRIIKQSKLSIDYKNTTVTEKAILSELSKLTEQTCSSIIEELSPDYKEIDVKMSLEDMYSKGWFE